MGIMHTFGSKVDSSRMPIGSCRLRPGSIDWFTMPYSSSRGVYPHPKQNIRRLPHLWGEAKILSPLKTKWKIYKNLQEFISPRRIETISAVNNEDRSHSWWRVDNSGMPIGSCRPRSGSIGWSTMPYNSSRGVHPRPKQNIRRILRMKGRHIFGVKLNPKP